MATRGDHKVALSTFYGVGGVKMRILSIGCQLAHFATVRYVYSAFRDDQLSTRLSQASLKMTSRFGEDGGYSGQSVSKLCGSRMMESGSISPEVLHDILVGGDTAKDYWLEEIELGHGGWLIFKIMNKDHEANRVKIPGCYLPNDVRTLIFTGESDSLELTIGRKEVGCYYKGSTKKEIVTLQRPMGIGKDDEGEIAWRLLGYEEIVPGCRIPSDNV